MRITKLSGRLKSDYVLQFCHKVIKYIEFGRIVYNKSAKNCINIVDLADSFWMEKLFNDSNP